MATPLAASARVLAVGAGVATAAMLVDKSLFSAHPVSTSLAFLACLPDAVLRSVSAREASTASERLALLSQHAIVQSAAAILGLSGFVSIFAHKASLSKAHFTSWHGCLGIVVFSSMLLNVLGGALAFKRIGLLQRLPKSLQARVKTAHRFSGWAVTLTAMANAVIGLQHPAVHIVRALSLL